MPWAAQGSDEFTVRHLGCLEASTSNHTFLISTSVLVHREEHGRRLYVVRSVEPWRKARLSRSAEGGLVSE